MAFNVEVEIWHSWRCKTCNWTSASFQDRSLAKAAKKRHAKRHTHIRLRTPAEAAASSSPSPETEP